MRGALTGKAQLHISPRRAARGPAFLVKATVAIALVPGLAWAGGSARDYLNAPINTWLTFSNSGYSMSVTPEDGLDVTSPIRTNVFSQAVIVTRTIDLWGRTGGISAIVPYAALDLNTDVFDASNAGFSDLGLMFQTNIFGGPALTREQFGSFVPQTFSSFHLVVNAPTGKYDAGSLLNPSSNRWTFFPTINYSYTPDQGWTWLEVYLATRLFTTNPDFGPGAAKLDQDPLYLAEGHASRNLNSRLWVSADAYYSFGGETRIDGIEQNNAANTLRLGMGLGLQVWAGGQLMLNYEQVVAKPEGQPDAKSFRLKIQQVW